MSCRACEDDPIQGTYFRWRNANIEIVGCKGHVKEVIDALRAAHADAEAEGEQPGLRPPVLAFAWLMEQTLRKHDSDKDGWHEADWGWLLGRLQEETLELREALTLGRSPVEIGREAADIANFAMMIADNCLALKTTLSAAPRSEVSREELAIVLLNSIFLSTTRCADNGADALLAEFDIYLKGGDDASEIAN